MRLLPVLALVVGCSRPATPPPAVPQPSAERVSGQLLSELLLGSHGPLEDPELTAYVRRVGARVARAVGRRDETWRVELSDDPKPLAHALPGGTLLVSRGALAYLSSEAELAAILAHELAHAAHGHTELGKTALPAHATLGAARQSALDADEERQADALAVRYVARAGYDPKAVGRALAALGRAVVLECQRELERDDCASAHDADDPHPARPARQARVALVAGDGGGEVGRERYLRALDGLPLGGHDAESSRTGAFVPPAASPSPCRPGSRRLCRDTCSRPRRWAPS
ncbi:MAG: M48 family metallopeptidase [Myxococcales bacterium]|nr:M48 family metallopeptidase [Myxococcales bacterium]